MAFNKKEVDDLLSKCRRRCCVCYKFCGVKMELHHNIYKSNGGEDNIENAIPLCFECHAEVNHYNPQHPKGRKYTVEELFQHKKQWLEICDQHPEVLISAPRNSDVGSLEGMLLELSYNNQVITDITEGLSWKEAVVCQLYDDEYKRSISQGSQLLLTKELQESLAKAYSRVTKINNLINMFINASPGTEASALANNELLDSYRKAKEHMLKAHKDLNNFLSDNKGGDNK